LSLGRALATHCAFAAAAIVALAAPVAAQAPGPNDTRVFEYRIPIAGPRYGQGEPTPLPPAVQGMIIRGKGLGESGRLDAARDTLTAALARAPHHPVALVELATVLEARGAWRALEQLARAERAAAHDSLLLADDLRLALQRLGKPKEAALVVFEAWAASPAQGPWAQSELDSLLAADSKGVREAAHRVVAAFPTRIDLVRGAAVLDWSAGDASGALKLLRNGDQSYKGAPLRWGFAEELLAAGSTRDSSGAVEVLIDLAGDRSREVRYRVVAARRAWETVDRRGGGPEGATRLAKAIEDVPVARWGQPLAIDLIRALRQGGATDEARHLLGALGEQGKVIPEIALEHALNDLRDGPPERALEPLRGLAAGSDAAAFEYAEALFFSGQTDSALTWYGKASQDPTKPFTGAALERIYLIEDGQPKSALPLFGRLAYEQWRNDSRHAMGFADSLYRSLPHGSLWAQAAIALAALREATGDGKGALEPLLALAGGLADDRLAPLARQRAGDVYRVWYHDDAKALAQYEECLAKYPKAWNAPEVRRWVESMRRERRF